MSQAALSRELQAGVDEFLRLGGTITQLNWAGVPIDGTPLEPKPVRAFGREYERVAAEKALKAKAETPAEWCERVAAEIPPAPAPMPRARAELPVTTPKQDAEFAEFVAELLASEPVPDQRIITELRSIRAEASRLADQINALEAAWKSTATPTAPMTASA